MIKALVHDRRSWLLSKAARDFRFVRRGSDLNQSNHAGDKIQRQTGREGSLERFDRGRREDNLLRTFPPFRRNFSAAFLILRFTTTPTSLAISGGSQRRPTRNTECLRETWRRRARSLTLREDDGEMSRVAPSRSHPWFSSFRPLSTFNGTSMEPSIFTPYSNVGA